MRFLYTSDLHYALKQFDWLLSEAADFDLVVIGGDLLDLSSALDADVQITIVEKYLELLRQKTTLVVCSGNHDGDMPVAHAEARLLHHLHHPHFAHPLQQQIMRLHRHGRTYQVRLTTDAVFRGMEVSFAAEFTTIKGEWMEAKIPFAGFKGSFRGLDLPDERLDTSKVRRVSILIGDKKQAPFSVELDFIRTYGATATKG